MEAAAVNKHHDCSDEEPDDYTYLSLLHEHRTRECHIEHTEKEIAKLDKEVEKLRLEKKWCFDGDGKRLIPNPEEQAIKICEQLVTDPELVKDVVKALRMKKLDLQINIKKLKENCDTLKEEIR